MVQAPVRVRAPIAEKYINQRTQSFTRTHAKSMQQWLDAGRGSEADYYAWFRKEVERSARKWESDCAAIDRDTNLSFREKREEKNKLNRSSPSWDMLQEQRFIDQWGDPRSVDRSRLEALLSEHQDFEWANALREGQMQTVAKTPWELKFYEAVVNPQDGSVPLYLNAAEIRVAEPVSTTTHAEFASVEPSEPVNMVRQTTEPVPIEIDMEPPVGPGDYLSDSEKAAFKLHMETVARRTCPYCRTYFPTGLKPQHKGGAACKAAQAALK